MERDISRRKFLSLVGMLTLFFINSISTPKKINDEEEYVFINGWLLKKKDLNDL